MLPLILNQNKVPNRCTDDILNQNQPKLMTFWTRTNKKCWKNYVPFPANVLSGTEQKDNKMLVSIVDYSRNQQNRKRKSEALARDVKDKKKFKNRRLKYMKLDVTL